MSHDTNEDKELVGGGLLREFGAEVGDDAEGIIDEMDAIRARLTAARRVAEDDDAAHLLEATMQGFEPRDRLRSFFAAPARRARKQISREPSRSSE